MRGHWGALISRRCRLGVAILALAALSPAGALANCGAEGCPIGSTGSEALRGRFSFNVGYRLIEQNRLWDGNREITAAEALEDEGGTGHELELVTRTRSWTAEAGARLTDDLRLSLSVP